MSATRQEIIGWIERAKKQGCTHLVIACDTYDWENYPIFVTPKENVAKIVAAHSGQNMQQVDEVYSFTGKYSIEDQLKERRARHLD